MQLLYNLFAFSAEKWARKTCKFRKEYFYEVYQRTWMNLYFGFLIAWLLLAQLERQS